MPTSKSLQDCGCEDPCSLPDERKKGQDETPQGDLTQPTEGEAAALALMLKNGHAPPEEFRPWLMAWANGWKLSQDAAAEIARLTRAHQHCAADMKEREVAYKAAVERAEAAEQTILTPRSALELAKGRS